MKKIEKYELNFIKNLSDEELKIANTLKTFSEIINFPLLDVWSWSWKISSIAFKKHEVIHLDRLNYSDKDFELPIKHTRIIGDFLKFKNGSKNIKSILFCHSLQYLDDYGIENIIKKIKEIDPKHVILVINKNNWILGKILKFFKEKKRSENWEKYFSEFPWSNFLLEKTNDISWKFYGKDISDICFIIGRLLLDTILSNSQKIKMIDFLEKNWVKKEIVVDQNIFLYKNKKNG